MEFFMCNSCNAENRNENDNSYWHAVQSVMKTLWESGKQEKV